MRRRNKGLLIVALTLLLALAFLVPQTVLAEKIVLRCASIYPAPDVLMSMGKAMGLWQEAVTKITKGEITFENFYGAALGPGPEHIELVKTGAVDVAQTFPWYTPGRFPVHSLQYVFPFGPTDPVMLLKSNREIKKAFPQFREDETKQNVIMVSDAPGGAYDFMSKEPLKTLADFNGQKVGLVGRYFGRWLPPGATAVVRPMHDRYELLQNGVTTIDLHPFTHFYFTKVQELIKYYTHAKLMAGFHACIFVNLDTWNKLPRQYQIALQMAGEIAEDQMVTEVLPGWWSVFEDLYLKEGVKFSTFPESEIKKWADGLEDIPAEWAADVSSKGYPGDDIVLKWQEITTANGYKWARHWGKK